MLSLFKYLIDDLLYSYQKHSMVTFIYSFQACAELELML